MRSFGRARRAVSFYLNRWRPPAQLNVRVNVELVFALLSGSATVGSLIGLALGGVVYALLPEYFPRGLIAGGVFALCTIVGLIYEFPFKNKNK
jgi:hypothetical protein